ncbi:PIN domain nuclease [Microcystis aeruginosa CS-563/04]|uniref:type II toxin-antitoxin system VapC family toxin n=1 Tax=Microcystis aeruginosa TaxID=1126 RepID=UPI00232C2A7C|nr:PIN domain nuclease [Microcystis aeruginosa]MDB9420383.1 PIN domain nuclease [Microcystis aeruginosa CS-563/04]
MGQGEKLYIAPQNLIEFWNVYTRPINRNGLGRTVAAAKAEIDRLKSLFPIIDDLPAIYPEWERLVFTYSVKGVQVHDAKLVAAMCVHDLIPFFKSNDRDGYAWYISILSKYLDDILGARGAPLPLAQ